MAHNSTTASEVPIVLSAQQGNTQYTLGVKKKKKKRVVSLKESKIIPYFQSYLTLNITHER